jgi:hypothetical protein
MIIYTSNGLQVAGHDCVELGGGFMIFNATFNNISVI